MPLSALVMSRTAAAGRSVGGVERGRRLVTRLEFLDFTCHQGNSFACPEATRKVRLGSGFRRAIWRTAGYLNTGILDSHKTYYGTYKVMEHIRATQVPQSALVKI
jgi:hypothetical protein